MFLAIEATARLRGGCSVGPVIIAEGNGCHVWYGKPDVVLLALWGSCSRAV